MATPYSTMNPAAQDALQVLLVKAAYYAQTAVLASGGPFMAGFYAGGMSPNAQDPLQVCAAKLAWWLSQLTGGGGGGIGGLTNGAGVPPVDGSVTTLFYRNTLTGQKYMNVGTTAVPNWEAI